MDPHFDAVVYAREELVPMLRLLTELTRLEGAADQHAYFARILLALERCEETGDLAGPFMELSTAAFIGLRYSPAVAGVLDSALEKAQLLSESLSLDEADVH